jgi:hypothetical protein
VTRLADRLDEVTSPSSIGLIEARSGIAHALSALRGELDDQRAG